MRATWRELAERKAALIEELGRTQPPDKDLARAITSAEEEIRAVMEEVPENVAPWPLSRGDFERWAESRRWVFAASSLGNPHEYALKADGDETMFYRAVLHIREFGREAVFGGGQYTEYDAGGYRYWSMGDELATTVLINRKLLSLTEDEEPRSPLACRWRLTKFLKARVLLARLAAREVEALELGEAGATPVRIERAKTDEDRYLWTSEARGIGRAREMDDEGVVRRLSARPAAELDQLLGAANAGRLTHPAPPPKLPPRQPALFEKDGRKEERS